MTNNDLVLLVNGEEGDSSEARDLLDEAGIQYTVHDTRELNLTEIDTPALFTPYVSLKQIRNFVNHYLRK